MQPVLPTIGTIGTIGTVATTSNGVKKYPPILSVIPEELIRIVLGFIKNHKDGRAFSITCKTLCAISVVLPREISFCWGQSFKKIGFLHKMQFNKNLKQLCLADSPESNKIAQDNFYKNFKASYRSYGLNPGLRWNELMSLFHIAKDALSNASKSIHDPVKKKSLKTIIADFDHNVFLDMVASFAKGPMTKMTPRHFWQCISKIQRNDPFMPNHYVQAAFRNALRTPANIQVMHRLADEHLDPSSSEFQDLKKTLEDELENLTSDIEDRIDELHGIEEDGEINRARELMLKHEEENGPKFESAKKSYEKLCAKLDSLAVWDEEDDLCGGLLDKVLTQLGNIDHEVRKLCPFFAELSLEVLPSEKLDRSKALYRVISELDLAYID